MRRLHLPTSVSPALDVVVLTLLYVLDLLISWDPATSPPGVGTYAVPLLGMAVYLPLLWRRQHPLLMLLLTVSASVVFAILMPPTVLMLGAFLGLFSVARHCRLRPSYTGFALAMVLVVVNVVAQLDYMPAGEPGQIILVGGLLGTMMAIASFAAGRWARSAARQRLLTAQLAAADERSRIARELHDVVAHAVSLMVLQAAGAEKMLDSNPERARAALGSVNQLGTQAITELRRMLGLLVPAGPSEPADSLMPAEAAPPRRLVDVGGLVEELRETGREVLLEVVGDPVPLEAGVDFSAYRIAQEALTNAAKYADASRPVMVQITWQQDEVRLSVRSQGAGPATPQTLSTGHGLLGMQERARAASSSLAAGPTPDGGFLVSAAFPTAAPTNTGTADRHSRFRRLHLGRA